MNGLKRFKATGPKMIPTIVATATKLALCRWFVFFNFFFVSFVLFSLLSFCFFFSFSFVSYGGGKGKGILLASPI